MNEDIKPDQLSTYRMPLMMIGLALILTGAFLLLLLAMMVFQVLTAPQDVALVQFVLDHVRAGDTAIYGNMTVPETGQNMDFKMNWSESVRTISFLFLGVAILGVLATILKILISGGIGIVRLAVGARD